jgi:hypothetical protein
VLNEKVAEFKQLQPMEKKHSVLRGEENLNFAGNLIT